MDKTVTIYDIAREAGVSTATVTRVLAGHKNVRQQTRERVQRVIDQYGYTPSAFARGLENGHSHTIGIILPKVNNPYFAELFASASDEAQRSGYSVWLRQISDDETVGDSVVEELIYRRLEGALFMGGIWDDGTDTLRGMLRKLGQYMPIVALCAPHPDLQCICLHNDLNGCMRSAVRHLHTLGHRRIAFIGGSSKVLDSGARGQGFLDEMRLLELEPVCMHEGGYDAPSGERAVSRLLHGMPKNLWPTALIAFNDLVALGAMKTLRQMGLHLPQDMAVIGCDNQFFCSFVDPPLTSMNLHTDEHARCAIRELLAAQRNPTPPFTLMHDATLVVRESCGVKLGYRKLD